MEEDKEYKYAEIIGYENYLIYEDGQVFSKKSKRFLKPSVNTVGYLVTNVRKNGKRKTMPIHRLIALYFIPNPENKAYVDHKDGNKLNNSIGNLRWATEIENAQNSKRPCNNKSGEKNVCWHKQRSKWTVRIRINGKYKHFGLFDDFEEAVMVASAIRQELHGEYARDA